MVFLRATIVYNPNATGMSEEVLKGMSRILTNQDIEVCERESNSRSQ